MRVVATAGHVDHGKSTLVRALTGMEPDRFAEEHRRGMTIDLGYAWMTLASGAQLAFVDVPGHQRFIGNMLTGLGPAPAVMFVVAADEGWRRQSAEHLAAVDALRVRHGLLVVTRADLADPGPALRDAQDRLAGSSVGPVPGVAVSARSGAGMGELREALDRFVTSLPSADPDESFRFWVDRAFTIRGAGIVVTGTLGGGRIAVGDSLVTDSGRTLKVRGLQVTGADRTSASGPARVALNLRGVDAAAVGRGTALLTPDVWPQSDTLDVALTTAEKLPAELVLHVGTASLAVRVRRLDESTARLTLPRALPVRAGDRGVLRDPGRQSIAAGVLVLDADPPSLARRGAARQRARELSGYSGQARLEVELARRGVARADQLRRLGVDLDAATPEDGWLVDIDLRRAWIVHMPELVARWAVDHPLDPGMPRAALARELEVPATLVDRVAGEAGLQVTAGRIVAASASSAPPPDLGPAEAGLAKVTQKLAAHPFDAPTAHELAGWGLGRKELAAAERAGRVLRLAGDVVLLPDAPRRASDVLAGLPQPFGTSLARQTLGTTRRVIIPLLEHLDRAGVTERVDDSNRRMRHFPAQSSITDSSDYAE